MKRRGISQVAIEVAIASYSLGYILGAVLPSQALYSFLCPWKTAQSVYSFLALLYFLRYQLLYSRSLSKSLLSARECGAGAIFSFKDQ